MRFRFEPLGGQDKQRRAAFSCGMEALDRYLRQQAGQEMRRGVAVVWVLHDIEHNAIAGYYTLSTASIVPSDLPDEIVRKLPRYPALPAMLIGRLAVDTSYRGQGFGGLLLADALHRALDLSHAICAIAVVVDAKDDAARQFYERFGFQRLAGHERRLFMPMATIHEGI
jgi:GNAT superfamily N-acetyltransferase